VTRRTTCHERGGRESKGDVRRQDTFFTYREKREVGVNQAGERVTRQQRLNRDFTDWRVLKARNERGVREDRGKKEKELAQGILTDQLLESRDALGRKHFEGVLQQAKNEGKGRIRKSGSEREIHSWHQFTSGADDLWASIKSEAKEQRYAGSSLEPRNGGKKGKHNGERREEIGSSSLAFPGWERLKSLSRD